MIGCGGGVYDMESGLHNRRGYGDCIRRSFAEFCDRSSISIGVGIGIGISISISVAAFSRLGFRSSEFERRLERAVL
jgi:hypothetical protein